MFGSVEKGEVTSVTEVWREDYVVFGRQRLRGIISASKGGRKWFKKSVSGVLKIMDHKLCWDY